MCLGFCHFYLIFFSYSMIFYNSFSQDIFNIYYFKLTEITKQQFLQSFTKDKTHIIEFNFKNI